jgi:D-3-phosphoglycerate dehydrogenase / 2-oxoglutarate reductase
VLTCGVTLGEEDVQALADAGATLVSAPSPTEELVIANCEDADGVIVGANEPFTARAIGALERCRVISRLGIGFDNIDVAAARAKGVVISIVPDSSVPEVSDHAIALLLAHARRIAPLAAAVRAGRWTSGDPTVYKMRQTMRRLDGQTLGIVGLGRIGQAVARKARAFGLRVIAHDPYVAAEGAAGLEVDLVALDALFREADFITLHAAHSDETHHIIDLDALRTMKPNAYLINNARGGLIDEGALYTALTEGRIAGAALDVTDPEPPDPASPLLQLDNVVVTAHCSHYSQESWAELRRRAVDAVVRVLQGGKPEFTPSVG